MMALGDELLFLIHIFTFADPKPCQFYYPMAVSFLIAFGGRSDDIKNA